MAWYERIAHIAWGIATSALAVAGVHSLAFIYFLLFVIYQIAEWIGLGDLPTQEFVEYGAGLLIGVGVGLWIAQ